MSMNKNYLINLIQQQKKDLKIQLKEKKRKLNERNNAHGLSNESVKKRKR